MQKSTFLCPSRASGPRNCSDAIEGQKMGHAATINTLTPMRGFPPPCLPGSPTAFSPPLVSVLCSDDRSLVPKRNYWDGSMHLLRDILQSSSCTSSSPSLCDSGWQSKTSPLLPLFEIHGQSRRINRRLPAMTKLDVHRS